MDHPIFTIDFETTDVDAKKCEPVEVAVLGAAVDVEWLIKPFNPIPPETSAVHHITDADVEMAPTWPIVRKGLLELFKVSEGSKLPILVAHNAEYERGVLLRPEDGEQPQVLWICTYKAALRVWPHAPSFKNEVLRYWLQLGDDRGRNSNQKPHSAGHDVRVTFLLLQELLKHATLEQMIQWTELPGKLPYMPMGKHYKQPWDQVPANYLQWCLAQTDMREDVKYCAKTELERRKGNAVSRSS